MTQARHARISGGPDGAAIIRLEHSARTPRRHFRMQHIVLAYGLGFATAFATMLAALLQ